MSGNILIERNTFVDIVGCPTSVDTGLIYFNVAEDYFNNF